MWAASVSAWVGDPVSTHGPGLVRAELAGGRGRDNGFLGEEGPGVRWTLGPASPMGSEQGPRQAPRDPCWSLLGAFPVLPACLAALSWSSASQRHSPGLPCGPLELGCHWARAAWWVTQSDRACVASLDTPKGGGWQGPDPSFHGQATHGMLPASESRVRLSQRFVPMLK